MKGFRYDVVKLLEAVKDRPCLWNKNIDNYKDRVERKLAWVEIFNILDERYEEMSSEDKRLTGETIVSKWTNIRDTFVKSLRSRAGKTKKQYILYDHLKFLIQVIPESEREEHDNLGYNDDQSQSTFIKDEPLRQSSSYSNLRKSTEYEISFQGENSSSSAAEVTPVFKERSSKRKRMKKESRKEDVEESNNSNIDFVSVDDPRIMNEDEAFFASLLPTIVKYNEDDRLEFRIEVLALMKRIKDKRKWSSEVVIG